MGRCLCGVDVDVNNESKVKKGKCDRCYPEYDSFKDKALAHLKTVKERVGWIYGKSQDCIDSNSALVRVYEVHFGEASESVTRAGRWWRSEKAKDKKFFRSEDLKERDGKLYDLNKGFWGEKT